MSTFDVRKVVFVDSCDDIVIQRSEADMDSCSSVIDVSFNIDATSMTTKRVYVGSKCPGKLPVYNEGGNNSSVYILPPFHDIFVFPNGTTEPIDLEDIEGYNAKYKRDVKGQTWYLRESSCIVISKKVVLIPVNPSDDFEHASIYIRKDMCMDCSGGYTRDAVGNKQHLFTFGEELGGYVRLVDSEREHSASLYSLTASSFLLDSGRDISLYSSSTDYIRIFNDLTHQIIHTKRVSLNVACVLPSKVRIWTSSAIKSHEPVTGDFRLEESDNLYALPNEVSLYQLTSNNLMDFGKDEEGNPATLGGMWFRSKGRVIDNNTGIVYIPFNADMGSDLLNPDKGAIFLRETDLVLGEDISPLNVVDDASGSPEVLQVSSKFVDVSVTPNKTYYGYPQSKDGLWGSDLGLFVCGQLCESDTSIDE